MKKEITVKISERNYRLLKASAKKDKSKIVDDALKQFFKENHKMKMRILLKRGYKTFGRLNLRLCRVLEEDSNF